MALVADRGFRRNLGTGSPFHSLAAMADIETILWRWKESLPESVSVAGMFARNPTAHKWKATYQSLVLRETVFWRTYDAEL